MLFGFLSTPVTLCVDMRMKRHCLAVAASLPVFFEFHRTQKVKSEAALTVHSTEAKYALLCAKKDEKHLISLCL